MKHSCTFVGKVGDGIFGQQLRAVAEEVGICMDYLAVDREVRTTLAFIKFGMLSMTHEGVRRATCKAIDVAKAGGVIKTTGAGDTFCACVLAFANAAAYLVTTRNGAIRSMPKRGIVERLLAV